MNTAFTGVHLAGQSNMSRALQAYIASNMPNDVWCAGDRHGGYDITSWIAGSTGAYTRSTHYNSDLLCHKGTKYEKLVLVWWQGETDAETDVNTKLYRERFEAYLKFIKEDLLLPGGELFAIFCLPWDLDSGGFGSVNGHGNGDRIRQDFINLAATDSYHYSTVETKDGDRTGDTPKVHVSFADVYGLIGPRIVAQMLTLFAK